MNVLKEFRPALLFLGKFLAIYFVGNILYGIYIESRGNRPDSITSMVTHQTAWLLDGVGYQTGVEDHPDQPKVMLKNDGVRVLNVFEGCNGINVIIVFIAFLFAFGGSLKKMALFLPLGILTIHFFNLLRISFLFYLALEHSAQFYFYHKYLFTATLYAVVFALWTLWVMCFNENHKIKVTA